MAYCTSQRNFPMVQEVPLHVIMRHAGVKAWDVSEQVMNHRSRARHSSLSLDLTTASPSPTTTWPSHVSCRQQQKNVSCSSKGWRDYLYFNHEYTEHDWLWTQRGRRSPARFLFIMPWYLSDGLQCRNKRPMNGAHPVLICLLNIRVNFQMYL